MESNGEVRGKIMRRYCKWEDQWEDDRKVGGEITGKVQETARGKDEKNEKTREKMAGR